MSDAEPECRAVPRAGRLMQATDAATEWASRRLAVVKRLPERAAYAAFDRAADMLWRRRGPGVVQFERNQARIHPDARPDDLAELSRLRDAQLHALLVRGLPAAQHGRPSAVSARSTSSARS